jgi:phytoene desaturase
VYYPVGGMGKLVESLKLLCEEYGVEIKTNVSVNRIIRKNGKVILSTKSKTFTADRVVVNADYQYAEQKLLQERDRSYAFEYWNKKTVAPSMFIMYLGIKGKVKSLKHHNFYFTDNWDKHFDEIFKNPRMPSDPSYYVCAPSKTDLNVAPKGDENLFFLVPIAPGLADTDEIRKSYVKKLITHFENLIGENISERIVYERVYSVRDFMTDYNAFQGTALGLTHTLLQTAFLRPKIQSKKIPEIYYVGQYTLPGIGVPMVLISAQVVAEKILNNDKQ